MKPGQPVSPDKPGTPGAAPSWLGQRANLLREWLLLTLALLALVAWLADSGALRRLDHVAHDAAMRLHMLPASQDIVIIAIDDASIAAIGRWPWRRALHAQAITHMAAQAPRAIALDVLFGEPDADYPGDDLLLERAIERAGNVVLPVAQRGGHAAGGLVDAPLPALRQAAAQLGHVKVHVDADGAVRHFFAREGPQAAPWPHVSVAMLCAAGQAHADCRGSAAPAAGSWTAQGLQGLVFTAGQPAFVQHSYVDLLKGRLDAQALRGKYVLVGATAVGLGDMFAAPAATQGGRMSGVELLAHALHAELAGARLQPASQGANLLFSLVPVATALLGLRLLGPLAGLMGCALLALASLLLATLAAPMLGWELATAPALVGIALAYPLWSWRRLSAAAHFLQLEMQALQRQMPLATQGDLPPSGDALERRILAVETASSRLRRLHHFVSESLQHLPLPTLICDGAGQVLLANSSAAQHLGQIEPALVGQTADRLLGSLHDPQTGEALLEPRTLADSTMPLRCEGRDTSGRDMLLLCQPHHLDDAALWLITLVDLSAIRQAQRQRDQALHFISHDIRAPAASILTLLEMQREFAGQLSHEQLLARIERHAQAALNMAQGFVQLASAQADNYQCAAFDLAAVLHEAVDEAWEAAQERQVQLAVSCVDGEAQMEGDRSLIQRAIGNVLGNALKFSPAGATVHCSLRSHPTGWRLDISDEGPGIAPELQTDIFKPFKSDMGLQQTRAGRVGSAGLGLAFVDTVVRRHGGSIQLDSKPGQGACFSLLLPATRLQG